MHRTWSIKLYHWQQIVRSLHCLCLCLFCASLSLTVSCGNSGYEVEIVWSTLGTCDFVLDASWGMMATTIFIVSINNIFIYEAYICMNGLTALLRGTVHNSEHQCQHRTDTAWGNHLRSVAQFLYSRKLQHSQESVENLASRHRSEFTSSPFKTGISIKSRLIHKSLKWVDETLRVCYVTAVHVVGELMHLTEQANLMYHTFSKNNWWQILKACVVV